MVSLFQIAISLSFILQHIFPNLENLSLRDRSGIPNQFTEEERTHQSNMNFLGNIEKIESFSCFSVCWVTFSVSHKHT